MCDVLLLKNQLGLVPGSTSGGYINGRIVCRFQRLVNVDSDSQNRRKRQTSPDTVFRLDTASYYILMAQGPVSGGIKLPALCCEEWPWLATSCYTWRLTIHRCRSILSIEIRRHTSNWNVFEGKSETGAVSLRWWVRLLTAAANDGPFDANCTFELIRMHVSGPVIDSGVLSCY